MMLKRLPGWYWTILLSLLSLGMGLLLPTWVFNGADDTPPETIIAQAITSTPTETLLPATPLASLTPRSTLRPAPTFEPPTPTRPASATPTLTPTQPLSVNVTIEGIFGLPSDTPVGTLDCELRDDWTLTVQVQTNETLSMIANRFDTTASALADANCLDDVNLIRVGQQLRVPGDVLPLTPEFICDDYALLTPINDAFEIPATGNIVFNWRGPRTPRTLLRIFPPDFDFNTPDPEAWIDYTFDLRQNETIDATELEAGGRWYWQVVPLDENFVQVCPESPLWTFTKIALSTPTPLPPSSQP